MSKLSRWLAVLAIAAFGAGGDRALAQNAPAQNSTAQNSSAGQEEAAGPDLPVLFVTGVEVIRTASDPKLNVIRVTGVTSSKGWSRPQLVPLFAGKPLDEILDLQFIAATPLQSQKAEGFAPIDAILTMDASQPFKGVRVRASENAIEVKQAPGHAEAKVAVDDCHDCIGKKFVEKGQAGGQGAIRQEDLPKVLRWLIPTRGVRGITHNPNRLNLVLGADNTIIDAYWE